MAKAFLPLCLWAAAVPGAFGAPATIDVDAARVTGKISPYLFGHFIEHEHNTIQGGLWAEMLVDRKFEQGDSDRDGVSNGWVAEERIVNRYWELVNGRTPRHRYFIDHNDYYGGGAAQGIELFGPGVDRAGVYQIDLQLVKGRRYVFYVYLKRRGAGKAWVDFEKLGGTRYSRTEFPELSAEWRKYSAEFTGPEDARAGRLRIGVQGTGTFWIDSASLMPADHLRGLRRDVLDALRPLRVPIMRYPGGCFADEYHWRNGVGERDRRPETWSNVWQEWDPNDFGTGEYMDLARQLGFDAHITANYASGTPEEAAGWAEYANGTARTPMGALRVRNGHPEPYDIRYWAVGNEGPLLCSGHYFPATDLDDYVTRLRQYQDALRKVDPRIRVMASGSPPGPPDWNRRLLARTPLDLLTVSIYTGEGRSNLHTRLTDLEYFYRKVVAEPLEFEAQLAGIIRDAGGRPISAVTEYNSWWLSEKVDPDYRLCNALYFAGVFHSLFRHAKEVFLAEVCSTINVQGVIGVNRAAVKLPPPYFAFLLYRQHSGPRVVAVETVSPAVAFNAALPALDAVATLSEDGGKLYLAVVNRSESGNVETAVQLRNWSPRPGTARIFELNGKDKVSPQAGISETDTSIDGGRFVYRFPAHSVTVLEIERLN